METESCSGPGGGCGCGPTEVSFGGQLYDSAEAAELGEVEIVETLWVHEYASSAIVRARTPDAVAR